jgi:hypothetical protein
MADSRKLDRRGLLLFASCFSICGCARAYQVGDYVLVEWGEDNHLYPAYIIELRPNARFRVHYEGYPARWDEVVPLPRIRGLVEGKVTPPPPPQKVRLALGLLPKETGKDAPVSQFKVGDRIKVKWRESVYRANVVEVMSASTLLVHYDGHESAFDEVVPLSRIVD